MAPLAAEIFSTSLSVAAAAADGATSPPESPETAPFSLGVGGAVGTATVGDEDDGEDSGGAFALFRLARRLRPEDDAAEDDVEILLAGD